MPIYTYECRHCASQKETYHKMSETPDVVCECGIRMDRVPSLSHSDLNAYHKPIEMYSVAVNSVEEAVELRNKCPDADISVDINHPDFGVPIARTRKAKLQVLKASGMRERN